MEWTNTTLKTLISVKKGEYITKKNAKCGPYPVILGGKEPAYFIDRFNHDGKAIVISRSGNAGLISFWNEPIFVTDGFIITPISNISYEFLYILLRYVQPNIQNLQNGATIQHITPKQLYGIKIALPPIAIQEKIRHIISSYDQLIENNTRRIALLEKMAQELYKEWFVRFRFPGHEHVKMVNGVPEGWHIKRLYEFGRIETGKTPSTENPENYGNEILFVKTPDMHGNMYVLSTEEKLSNVGHETQPKKLIPPNSIMVTCIGTAGVVAINTEKVHTNQQINSIILDNQNNLEWLYFACKHLKETIELFGSNGATMTNLNKGKFEKLKVLSPSEEQVNLYHNATLPIFNEIKQLEYKNRNLIKQRDLLLPHLMSGKLELT